MTDTTKAWLNDFDAHIARMRNEKTLSFETRVDSEDPWDYGYRCGYDVGYACGLIYALDWWKRRLAPEGCDV